MILAGTTCTVYALYCPVWTTQCRVNLKRFMQEMQPLQDQTTDNPPPCYSYFQLTYVFVIFPLQCRLLPTSLSYMIHHLFPFLYLASIHPPPPYSFFSPVIISTYLPLPFTFFPLSLETQFCLELCTTIFLTLS